MSTDWQNESAAEITAAHNALKAGLPGRARVAARRAAGISLAAYNRWVGITADTHNYYDLLRSYSTHPGIPEEIREIAGRLCQRVNEQHSLPDHYDLVADAEKIIKFVAHQTNKPVKTGEQYGGRK